MKWEGSAQNCLKRVSQLLVLVKYNLSNDNKEDEVGR